MTEVLVLRNAQLVDVVEGQVRPGCWLLAADGVIERIGSEASGAPELAQAEVVDVAGAFVAPGFVSSHSHLFSSASRGLGVGNRLYEWATEVYKVTRTATPDQIYWCTVHGALDALGAGVTTVFDFVDPRTVHQPVEDSSVGRTVQLRPVGYVRRQIDAHCDAGIRSVLAFQIELSGRLPEQALAEFDKHVDYVRADRSGFLLDAAVFGAAQWASGPLIAELEVIAMRRWGLLNQAHLFETDQRLSQQHRSFDWYVDAGALSPSMIFGHFVHPNEAVVEACRQADAGVSWQPVANGRLASGVMAVSQLRQSGLRIGLGLDDQACSDLTDPWQNMRFGLYQARAVSRTADLMPLDVLRMQTIGAARLIGVDAQVGSLQPGKLADLVVVDPASPDVGPLWDPLASYVLSMSTRNLKRVYVGGQLRSLAGSSSSLLAAAASQEIRAMAETLVDL